MLSFDMIQGYNTAIVNKIKFQEHTEIFNKSINAQS